MSAPEGRADISKVRSCPQQILNIEHAQSMTLNHKNIEQKQIDSVIS